MALVATDFRLEGTFGATDFLTPGGASVLEPGAMDLLPDEASGGDPGPGACEIRFDLSVKCIFFRSRSRARSSFCALDMPPPMLSAPRAPCTQPARKYARPQQASAEICFCGRTCVTKWLRSRPLLVFVANCVQGQKKMPPLAAVTHLLIFFSKSCYASLNATFLNGRK